MIINMLVAISTTKVPINILHKVGFLGMAYEVRTDWVMLLGAIFLLIFGAGRWSFDARIGRREKSATSEVASPEGIPTPEILPCSEIAECPNCHGRSRVPSDLDVLMVTCPKCRHCWEWTPSLFTRPWSRCFNAIRNSWAILLVLGTHCLAGTILVSVVPGSVLTLGDEIFVTCCQAGMTGAGAFLLLLGVLRYQRPDSAGCSSAHLHDSSICYGNALGFLCLFLRESDGIG